MKRKTILTSVVVILILVSGISAYLYTGSEIVDCESKYEELERGEISTGDIPEDCEPLPEEVEKTVLIQALGDSDG